MREIKTYSQKESKEMLDNNINDFKYVYDFQIEGEKIVPPKIKFDKCVYDRVEAFNTEEAADLGWTIYRVFRLIMGELDKEDYDANPLGNESMFEPSDEFKHWLDMHYMWGPLMIMQALLYGNYELKKDKTNETN